ncbi:MAG: lamin tail domain-containing protein, partial [Planctomycetia bacterium]|nr:lamin tail domain-containing protein [Planctomycetia bacterium]
MRPTHSRPKKHGSPVERLEARWVMDGLPLITEFMALNESGIQDEDGDRSDWIEIYNPGPDDFNLNDWFLTDDATELDKCEFPSQSLTAGNFLVVFASNKDRAIAGQQLHTNFGISGDGEYLALTRRNPGNNQIQVVSAFDPTFGQQYPDVSYGVEQSVAITDLVAEGGAAKIFFPANNNLHPNWTQRNFSDGAFTNATTAIGYEVAVPGMTTKKVKSNGTVSTLSEAETLLVTPSQQASVVTQVTAVVNFLETGGTGNFSSDLAFPGSAVGNDTDHFITESVGTVTIPAAGQWTFGVNSDDGFKLQVGNFTTQCDCLRGASDTLQTFNFPAAGKYPIRLLFFERDGGGAVELFAAPGAHGSFNASFDLVGATSAGGLAVETDPGGGAGVGFGNYIDTDVEASMFNSKATVYMRAPFNVANPAELDSLTLRLRYDDAIIVYLNGTEVARRNAPASVVYNTLASSDRAESLAVLEENIDISAHIGLLVAGQTNILAIHGLNDALNSNEFLLTAQLSEITANNGQLRYFQQATPGDFNPSTGFIDFVAAPTFSAPHGWKTSSFNLTLATTTPGAQIRYTTDGSMPTASSTLYSSPINVSTTRTIRAAAFKTGFEPSRAETATYLFMSNVLSQQPNGQVPGAGWATDPTNGQEMNYGMDPNIVGNGTYGPLVDDALLSITSVSVVMDLDDLFDQSTGIYVNAYGEGRQWERPASVELITPGSPEGFQIDAGIRIRGGFSRTGDNPKHAFRLFFRDEYEGDLNYAWFGDEGVDEFENMDLRTAQNYSWSFQGDGQNTMNRDVFSRDLQRDLGDPYTRSRYHHLFINGVYWGLFQSQERSEASFAANYFGGEKDDYDVVKAEAGPYTLQATDGNLEAWLQFWEGANAVDAAANETERFALYQKLKGLNPDGTRNPNYAVHLDSRNLIDYMLAIIYGGNLDAPISNFLGNTAINNWYGLRDRTGTEGWRFFAHDSEHTLLNVNEDRSGPFPAGAQEQHANPQWIFQQLWASEDFRLEVADRIQETFFGDGALTPAANTARFMARKNELDLAIIAESARWGDAKREPAFTKADWQNTINGIVNNYFPARTNVVLNQLKQDGLYPDVDPPVHVPNGGNVPSGHDVEFATIDGVIYYTIDGSDPRLPGGGISPDAIAYNNVTNYVSPTTDARWRIPDGTEGAWQQPAFNHNNWSTGPMPIGFDTGVITTGPGFTVRTLDTSSGSIDSINTASNLLNGNTNGFTIASDTSTVMSYVNLGDSGNFGSPPTLPVPGTVDREQYAIRVTASIIIPVGTWTLAVGSDDGFRLTIPNTTFSSRFNDNGTQPTNGFSFSSPRGHGQSGGTFTVAGSPLTTTIMLDFYEAGGGDSLELSLASGSQGGFNGNFQILQNGTLGWNTTTTAIPFDFDPLIETDIQAAMHNVRAGAYLRMPFNASSVSSVQALNLRMKYDDGFVAYLNGVKVAERNAPASPTFSSNATVSRADQQAVVFETIDISNFRQHLINGGNVLAIHGLNVSAGETDFFIEAQLDSYSVGSGTSLTQSSIVNARTKQGSDWSALASAEFFIGTPASASNLSITELNYNPYEPTPAEVAAGFVDENAFEYVELRNTSGQTIDLAGVEFTGLTFNFSGADIIGLGANKYVLIVSNRDAFEMRYGTGLPIAGVYTGALANSGEPLKVSARNGDDIDNFAFDDTGDWPGRADGNGSSLEVISVTGNYNDPQNWRPSTEYGGSPGKAGIGDFADVVVNEILTHTDPPQKDSVELYNTTNASINIGGWYISDSNDNYAKFRIPNNTFIPAHGYLVFDEDDFNPNPTNPGPNDFSFNAAEGDDTWLLAANTAGKLLRFADRGEFGAAANGVSFGRWPNATGELFPMTELTLGGPNSGPLFGPVLISEVMYNPLAAAGDDDLEFIELFNSTANPIDLTNWRISGGVDLVFGAGRTIGALQTLIVVRFDPTDTTKANAFRTHYSIGPEVNLVGPYAPLALLDSDGTVRLERPDEPPANQPELIPYLLVDQVKYDNVAPWPQLPNASGHSLTRLAVTAFGDFSASWGGEEATPGDTDFAPNNLPTISAIDNLAINEDGVTPSLDFTVGDVETPLNSLSITRSSSNTTLVPNANIVITGSGANRSVVVTPASNQFGSATITITVDDGDDEVTETFVLTVNPINDLPTISAIPSRSIPEDGNTGAIAFTIGDVETALGALVLTAESSNTNLVPLANIVFGGSGASRTVTVTPAGNLSGAAIITITLSDGTGVAIEDFELAVDSVNDPPTVSAIDDLTINENTNTGPIAFTVGDPETAAGALTVSAVSSNPT